MLYFKVDDPIIEAKQSLENDEIENLLIEKLKLNGLILCFMYTIVSKEY